MSALGLAIDVKTEGNLRTPLTITTNMLAKNSNTRHDFHLTLTLFWKRFANAPLFPTRSHIFLLRLPIKVSTFDTWSFVRIFLYWDRILFCRIPCHRCKESNIHCLDIFNTLSLSEHVLRLSPSVCLAPARAPGLAESIDFKPA